MENIEPSGSSFEIKNLDGGFFVSERLLPIVCNNISYILLDDPTVRFASSIPNRDFPEDVKTPFVQAQYVRDRQNRCYILSDDPHRQAWLDENIPFGRFANIEKLDTAIRSIALQKYRREHPDFPIL